MRIYFSCLLLLLVIAEASFAQNSIQWNRLGDAYFTRENGAIIKVGLPGQAKTILVGKEKLAMANNGNPLVVKAFRLSEDESKLLLFTNTRKVWRYETRGDYWVTDTQGSSFYQLGRSLPTASLMFAKFSPDGTKVAYVSGYNLYVEDLATGVITALTKDGNRQQIYGTFDWAYEEEFFCRDGFRWSPDSKKIAFWKIIANQTKDYLMVNNTDSIYPVAIPVEYPVAGEKPSTFKIGVVEIGTGSLKWMDIPDNGTLGSYLPRMEWAASSNELVAQHLDRKQQVSTIFLCDANTGKSTRMFEERDSAWIDILPLWDDDYANGGWDWLAGGKEYLWASEKDGWRHLYRLSRDGKKEVLVTKGNYDVMDIVRVDEPSGWVYFMASPANATQKYLYRCRLDGKGAAELVSPADQEGTHDYQVGPGAKYALHSFTNHFTSPVYEWINMEGHRTLDKDRSVAAAITTAQRDSLTSYFSIKTADGVTMDAWMVKPKNFDPAKKYPVVFYVYTEPWGQNVKDQYGITNNFLYSGDFSGDGYVYVSIDNRGTPVPKGREWRKAVYRKIGIVNIRDQAMAAREILKLPFVDTSRVAVWGWSGGGSATLNLMFQYPDIYKTGIAIAAVGNQLTYDNIYQERYMGLPQENREDFVSGSPITYAANLRGNLLYIHGTGDDNVHFNNAEMLVNELVKHGKQFQFMSYPNRSHSISEGEGTFRHLSTLYTNFLRQYCPPGGR
ncbi:S9 family peptidase [Flavihumibacter rivuli]|uniref:S9 family peptidase n=1 Tax=Flavihumibacter rivuli TaxID=2838156 RepID=UPI001BDE11F2|nr:DPP IV N-terminal domain-containing protein [Flavihumibacter rivuli]ULQ58039.1 S9 family peptidase [Flavihumibacter rivuli]